MIMNLINFLKKELISYLKYSFQESNYIFSCSFIMLIIIEMGELYV